MNEGPHAEETLSPAEERLLFYLLLLRGDGHAAAEPSGATVMRAVRWQLALRNVLRALGELAAALAEGAMLLLGRGRTR